VGFAVVATGALLVAVFDFATVFLTAGAAGEGFATTLALAGVELRLFDFIFFAAFFAGFLGTFFAAAVFLTVFLAVFLAVLFAAFFAVFLAFFAPRLLTFARFFTADAFAVLVRADLPAFFAPRFLTVFFLGVATTNSFMLKPDC
jgi:hypothetical protein